MRLRGVTKCFLVFYASLYSSSFFARSKDLERKLSESGVVLARVPAGNFPFGRLIHPDVEDEAAGVNIAIRQAYWMSTAEISQGVWSRVTGEEFTEWAEKRYLEIEWTGKSYPVYNVSYFDACRFCDLLTKLDVKSGVIGENQRYQLPSETQWEYACRAGTTTPFYTGASIAGEEANLDYEFALPPSLTRASENEVGVPRGVWKIDQMKPNPWGFFGMAGNVGEWCLDIHRSDSKPLSDKAEPLKAGDVLANVAVVVRGGNWKSSPRAALSASRFVAWPWVRRYGYGFRVVLVDVASKTDGVELDPKTNQE